MAFGIVAGLVGCEEPSVDDFLQRARTHREAGNLRASVIELKNALQRDPSRPGARLLLGRTYLEIGDFLSAEKELLRARDLGAEPAALIEPLARLWLLRGNYRRILDELVPSDAMAPAERATLLHAHGAALLRLGEPARAEQVFRQALTEAPDKAPGLVGLARAALAQNRVDEAKRVLTEAVTLSPDDPEVIGLQAALASGQGDSAAAEAAYRRLLELTPEDIGARLALGVVQLRGGRMDEAAAMLAPVLEIAPGHPEANFAQALVAVDRQDYLAARAHAERVLAAHGDHVPSLLVSGAASYAVGEFEQAHRRLARAVAEAPTNELARRLHLATRLRLRELERASPAPLPLLDDSAEPVQLLDYPDTARQRRGNLAEGAAFLVELGVVEEAGGKPVSPSPGARPQDAVQDPVALLALATASARAGRIAEARAWSDRLLAIEGDGPPPRVPLSWAFLLSGYDLDALALAQAGLARNPEEPGLLAVAGLAHLALGEPSEAAATLLRLARARPRSAPAQYLLALAYRDGEEPERLREQLERVLELDPQHRSARLQLAAALARRGDLEAAAQQLDALRRVAPEQADMLELAGVLALLGDQAEEAAVLLGRAAAGAPSGSLAVKLAYVQARAGRAEASRATLEDWLEAAPADVPARLALANRYLSAGELAAARRHYGQVIVLEPDNAIALNNLAWADLRLGDALAALPHAERAAALAPDDPRTVDTLALVRLALGEAEAAARLLQGVVQAMPGDPEMRSHLASALAAQGKRDEARALLRQILSEGVDFPTRADAQSLLLELGG